MWQKVKKSRSFPKKMLKLFSWLLRGWKGKQQKTFAQSVREKLQSLEFVLKNNWLQGFLRVLWTKRRTTTVNKNGKRPKKSMFYGISSKICNKFSSRTRRFLFPDEKRKFFRSVFRKNDVTLKNFWKKWPNCSPGYVERRYGNTRNDCFAHGKKRAFCFFSIVLEREFPMDTWIVVFMTQATNVLFSIRTYLLYIERF